MEAFMQCGHQNPDGISHCAVCGAPLTQPPTAGDPEIGHLEYLLLQIPKWKAQGIIPPGSAVRLANLARRRLTELTASAPPHSECEVRALEPPSVQSGAAPPVYGQPPSKTSPPVKEPRPGPNIAAFFEEHWLKLLAVLASTFILAGVRQVMGVAWVARAAMILVPVAPFALSVTLLRWVLRTTDRRSIAARACGGVGIVLAAFTLSAINKHWLGGAIPSAWSLLACSAAGALTAAALIRATGDRVYVHYELGFVVLAAPLLVLALAEGGDTERLLPWHVAAGFAVAGTVLLGWALRSASVSAGAPAADTRTLLTWGLTTTSGSVAFALVQASVSREHLLTTTSALLLCALSAGVVGRLVQSGPLAFASVVAATVAGFLIVSSAGSNAPLTWGYLAAALGVIWAGAGANVRKSETPTPSPATVVFGRSCISAFAVAGLMLALVALEAVGEGHSLGGTGWERIALLAAVCTLAYVTVAHVTGKPDTLYAASGALALAVGVSFSALLRLTAFQRFHHAGHDMAAASTALMLIGAFIARHLAFLQSEGGDSRQRVAWLKPWLRSGAIVTAFGIATTVAWTMNRGVDSGTWAALSVLSVVTLGACWFTRTAADRYSTQAMLFVGLAGLVSLAGLAGSVWMDAIGAGAALMASALLCTALAAHLAGYERETSPAHPDTNVPDRAASAIAAAPLRLTGAGAYIVASLILADAGLVTGQSQSLLPVRVVYVLAVAAAAFAWTGVRRVGHDSFGLAGAALTLAQCWVFYLAAPSAILAGTCAAASATCAVAFAWASRSESAAAPWLSAVAAALTWYGLLRWIGAPIGDWVALAMLPGLVLMYGVSEIRAAPEPLRCAMRRTAAATLMLMVASMEIAEPGRPEAHLRLAITAGAFTLAVGFGAVRRLSANWTAAAAGLWSLTSAHAMCALDLIQARWALGFVACAAAFPAIVLAMGQHDSWKQARHYIGAIAATHAILGVYAALLAAPKPGGGVISVVTIALAGIVLASLCAARLGAVYAHLAAGCFLVANGMFVYDRVRISAGVLDLYLIPLGAYLLALGHIANRRARTDEAAALWWTGALTVVTPTFLAFWTHFVTGGPVWHALLLVAECLIAILWGIAHRIRAFVIVGAGFALAFAAVLASASVQEVWVGLIALVFGLALLGAVIRLSTRAEATRSWLSRIWEEWRSWR